MKDFHIDNILIDENSHENVLIYEISNKTLIGAKSLHIRFDKIDRFIKIYDETWCLIVFGSEIYDAIYNRIRDLICLKSSVTYVFSHYYPKIKVDSYDSLPIEKRLTLHNVITANKSVLNKDQFHYYYKM